MASTLVRTDLSQLVVGERYVGYEADERGEKLWAGQVVANYGGVFAVIEQSHGCRLAVVMRTPRVNYRFFSADFELGPTPQLETSPELALMASQLLMEKASSGPWISNEIRAYVVACGHGWCCHNCQGETLRIGQRPIWFFGHHQGEVLRAIRGLLEMCGQLCDRDACLYVLA